MTWRLLVIANETLATGDVRNLAQVRSAGRRAEVLVIAPALMGRIAYWSSDDAGARRVAETRLRRCLESLRSAGIAAEGTVGDADPLLALADALAVFPADEVLIASPAPHDAGWLERDLVPRARERFPGPIHHVVVAGERLTRVAAA